MNTQSVLSILTILFGVLSLLSLLILHFASPEFQPSWRMVSEYALGKHHWLITSFFVFWCLSSLSLSFLLWPNVSGVWTTLGVLLLMLSGMGELMGGLFDVKHPLHGLSFMLGVPSLPIAALLIGYHLINKEAGNTTILLASHAPWISLILMAIAMIVMMSGFKNAGIPMGPEATPPDHVPDGVIALAGYANRLLIISYIGWLLVIANYLKNIKL
jgi:hypothetical protein